MNGMLKLSGNPVISPVSMIPLLDIDNFIQEIYIAINDGWRVSSYFGHLRGDRTELYVILADDARSTLGLARALVVGPVTSLAELLPELSMFEREISEQCGVTFEGDSWRKPVRFPGGDAGVADYYLVNGEEVHEVAVGPVHAGIIEPGHFRFQCHGEEVFHLEIMLGYQHRGVERRMVALPVAGRLQMIEAVAGDTTTGHAWAYCMLQEALHGVKLTVRSDIIRGIALELERLANHTGDLGALAGDVGYLPTSSFCGRIRGDFLNITALLCGSRFGRGLLFPGGLRFDITTSMAEVMLSRLELAGRELAGAVELLWNTPSVMNRFEQTGIVTGKVARELGLVGPTARASGVARDLRQDHPFGPYRAYPAALYFGESGDVLARAEQRWGEAYASISWISKQIEELPGGSIVAEPLSGPFSETIAVAMVEGWRGEICHVAITDESGALSRYKITDPSFHNWQGLAFAMRGGQISDFPLCNKSFNLSYCGFDL